MRCVYHEARLLFAARNFQLHYIKSWDLVAIISSSTLWWESNPWTVVLGTLVFLFTALFFVAALLCHFISDTLFTQCKYRRNARATTKEKVAPAPINFACLPLFLVLNDWSRWRWAYSQCNNQLLTSLGDQCTAHAKPFSWFLQENHKNQTIIALLLMHFWLPEKNFLVCLKLFFSLFNILYERYVFLFQWSSDRTW